MAEAKWVTGRNAGRFRFVEAEVTLRVASLEKAEVVSRRMEERIRKTVPHVERVLIHVEPVETTHLRFAAPVIDPSGVLCEHFGESPHFAFAVVRRSDGKVERQTVLPNPHQRKEKAKGIRVAEWLVEQKVDAVFLKESLGGKGPVYVFGDAGVEMRETEAVSLEGALEEARKEDVR